MGTAIKSNRAGGEVNGGNDDTTTGRSCSGSAGTCSAASPSVRRRLRRDVRTLYRLVGSRRDDRRVELLPPGTPVTYIGHSYGGSVVGSADQLGLRADRILYASSAGTGVYNGPWNNANPDVQRFSMTAPGDMIGATQSIDQRVNPHGADTDEVPGVTRLDTGYYSADNGEHPGQVVFGPDGHGDYWNDRDSTAFRNMVGVVSGGEVTGYVERGIESNNIDVDLGDEGDGLDEGIDGAKGIVIPGISGFTLPRIPGLLPPITLPEFAEDPYGNPVVTDNAELGPRINVK